MTEPTDIESTDLTQRAVLGGLAHLSAGEDTPAHAGEIVTACNDALDVDASDVLGRLAEADAVRALNELEAAELVAADRDDASPSGKGRPRYELAVDRSTVLVTLDEDDRLEGVVERVRAE